MRRTVALCLVILVTFSGCASYTARPVPLATAEGMPIQWAEDSVEIGVDPYLQVERQKAVFDESFSDEGVLAIRVLIKNTGSRRLVVRAWDMTLEFPDGRQLTAARASEVAAKVSGGAGSLVAPTIAFGMIGLLVASQAKEKAQTERKVDYRSKELGELVLGTNEVKHGFVYFIAPEKPAFTDAALTVRVIDEERATPRVVVKLPLSGREKPSVIKTPE